MASMLSYRHAFHAGNHADVLKHAIVSRIAIALLAKEKPFSYLDTHAGAGIYCLDDEWAKKTGEAEKGIERLLERDDIPPLLVPYVDLCAAFFKSGHQYPGSPEIVRSFARAQDRLTLLELHPAEIENLRANLAVDSRVRIHNRDGYAGVLALSPPEPRRGFALMDPSYETADDYEKTAETLIALHRRWPVGILALWYPIVARRESELARLKDRFATSGIEGILTAELSVKKPQSSEHGQEELVEQEERDAPRESAEGFGLLGSGMLIISPPWKLEEELSVILPWLVECFGENNQGSSVLEWLSLPR